MAGPTEVPDRPSIDLILEVLPHPDPDPFLS